MPDGTAGIVVNNEKISHAHEEHECESCGRQTAAEPEMHGNMPYYFCSPTCRMGKAILD